MSPYSGNKCSEEEELDLFYLEIEERILLLISEEEEEEEVEDRNRSTTQLPFHNISSFLDASWYSNSFIEQLQPTKQGRRGCYGTENIGKKIKPWIHEYGARNNGGKRVPESSGRKGTGVFFPKSLAHSC
ncbi:hypothetical protein MA16_Dca007454 [Dendrobium catenatum]|uniref:Uncharacterized protein n=1 Tax=Dendrobium catenatum TaxID=906689 RepID=A0A2I0WAP9_9ASPA|nr:hypothetical protein MA16_Dca007454 [Dendrobium catenatum]